VAENERDAWVSRVLGIAVAGAAGTDLATLRARLAGLAPMLQELRGAGAAEFATLVATLRSVTAGLAAPDAPAQVEALEAAAAAALSAARRQEAAAAVRRPINSAKLLLRWRGAQSQVAANIIRLGQAVLARPDVQDDPRLPEVEAHVARLPELVPAFGPALEDLLDQAMNDGSTAGIASRALSVIAGYRQSLAAASGLLAFETVAAENLGGDTALLSALDGALGELERELQAAA
jgi:hypothetical protein